MRRVTLSSDLLASSHKSPLSRISVALQLVELGLKNGDPICLSFHISPATKKRGTDGRFKVISKTVSMTFPSLTAEESTRFARYLKLLKLIRDNIASQRQTTKRQLYYTDVALFSRQKIVDNYVDTISDCLGVSIETLGVVASQKGLIYGNFSFTYRGTRFKISERAGPALIPLVSLNSVEDDFYFDSPDPKEIIVLEKEAIFHHLCPRLKGHGIILITGKGFPDRLTKVFLHFVTSHYSTVPARALVDSDVYGLMIFNEYKCSAAVVSREHAQTSHAGRIVISDTGSLQGVTYEPACPHLTYCGVKLFSKDSEQTSTHYLPLTIRDVRAGQKFLTRLERQANSEIPKVIHELQLGLFLLLKKEMQEN